MSDRRYIRFVSLLCLGFYLGVGVVAQPWHHALEGAPVCEACLAADASAGVTARGAPALGCGESDHHHSHHNDLDCALCAFVVAQVDAVLPQAVHSTRLICSAPSALHRLSFLAPSSSLQARAPPLLG